LLLARDHGGEEQLEVVAWLHDVIEDTTVTRDEIEELFGPEIAEAVIAITRRPRMPAISTMSGSRAIR